MPSKTALAASILKAKGNVTQQLREALFKRFNSSYVRTDFLSDIYGRMKITEMDIFHTEEEPNKKQARLIFEVEVTEDMCIAYYKSVHGGCTAALIDICTSQAFTLLSWVVSGNPIPHVSVVLTTAYHAPAPLGCRLKIVCTTTAVGKRVMTAKAEMYDETHGRLVATGIHTKMPPSMPAKL